MTREEKINQLNDIFAEINEDDNAVCYLTSEDNELIESAIKALSQESCEDTISREQAIDAIKKIHPVDTEYDCTLYDKVDVMYVLEDLPSVQPKYNASEWCHDCKEYNQDKHCCPRYNKVIRSAVEEIKQPKVGHWIKITPSGIYMCSECEHNVLTGDIDAYHYCHHCGIKMIEPQESEE